MAGDLNLKKSWNPKLVKNQTKVWELEQKKLKQLKEDQVKNEEFKKEQEYLDLLKLQYGSDYENHLSNNEKLKVSKLSWMYEDVPFEKQEQETKNSSGFIESNAEFTDGKKEVESLLSGNQAFHKRGSKSSGYTGNDRLNKIIGSGLSNKGVSSSILENDPMALMKRQQQQKQKSKALSKDKALDHKSSSSSSSSSRRVHKSDEKHRHKSHRSSSTHSHSHLHKSSSHSGSHRS
ncbi:CWC25 [Candida jiufengensis]|uniref:CWC25 n=1 Tax=Candida jiufengensis TaxID=497108 RepID=UPI0022247FD6|nr:CWC25 [Candida jiufengensis]KAI5956363.1 CWC25 [Candida jiufengensis]